MGRSFDRIIFEKGLKQGVRPAQLINRQDLILTVAFSVFPFSPFDILSAKFAETMIVEYAMQIITIFPTMVLFGYKTGCGLLYYIYSILLFFFFLAFAVALGMSFTIVLMRLLNSRFLRPLKRCLLSLLQYMDILSFLGGILIGVAIVAAAALCAISLSAVYVL